MKKQDDDESKHLEQQDHDESKHLEHKMTPPANSAKRKQPGEERIRVKLHKRGFFAETVCANRRRYLWKNIQMQFQCSKS